MLNRDIEALFIAFRSRLHALSEVEVDKQLLSNSSSLRKLEADIALSFMLYTQRSEKMCGTKSCFVELFSK